MFDAIFKASNGLTFSFGYKAGVLWSITPLGDLPVDLETSQGYQQVGATVESRSISGVTRTVTGRILRNQDYCKRQLRDVFAPYVTGRLTIAGAYWCDAEVQRTPDISVSGLWPTFSFQLYCPDPYWHSVKELTVSTLSVTPTFRLPVCYDVHSYGVREQANYLRIANTGLATQDWALTLEARGPVVNPGVKDPETGEFLDTDVLICQDGRQYTMPAGSKVTLHPGESMTLYPYLYHEFIIPEGGPSLIGEVSATNDDNTDNRFKNPLGRYPSIEEDEAPYRLLCTEYPAAK